MLEILPVTFVSLTAKPTKVVPKVEELVPPLAIGRMPETSLVFKTIALLYRAPVAVECTGRFPFKVVIVVEPVTVNRLVPGLNVKLEDVAKVLVPAPKRISLEVKFCNWIVGVVPPEESTEPLPETEVT